MNKKVSATEVLNGLQQMVVQKTANYNKSPDKKHRAILRSATKDYILQLSAFMEQGAIASEYHGILTKTNCPPIVAELVDEILKELGKEHVANTAQFMSTVQEKSSELVEAKKNGTECFLKKVSGTFSNGAKWLWNPEDGKIQIIWRKALICLQTVKGYAIVAWNYIVEMWNRLVKAVKDCYGRITKKEVVAQAEAEMDSIAAQQSNVVPIVEAELCPA